jgi:hypothetical protein
MNATTRPRREVPPGGTPVRELAHAIARALTLPDDASMLAEPAYLRVSRDHAASFRALALMTTTSPPP